MDWLKSNFVFIPLLVFVLLGYNRGQESVEQWIVAWSISGALALAALVAVNRLAVRADRIFLGVNIYLLAGGLLALGGPGPLLGIYGGYLRGVSLFLVILLVGLYYTVSGKGFVNLPDSEPAEVRRRSVHLLLTTLACVAFAWVFRGQILYEGTLPFFVLYVTYLSLSKSVRATTDESH